MVRYKHYHRRKNRRAGNQVRKNKMEYCWTQWNQKTGKVNKT